MQLKMNDKDGGHEMTSKDDNARMANKDDLFAVTITAVCKADKRR
jgi:hypothetical protein